MKYLSIALFCWSTVAVVAVDTGADADGFWIENEKDDAVFFNRLLGVGHSYPPPPPPSSSSSCATGIVGAYVGTGYCRQPGGLSIEATETNTVTMLPVGDSSLNDPSWIRNIVESPGGFVEVEECTRNEVQSKLAALVSEGPVYDCVTMTRSDTVPDITANVILQYSFNQDCSSFDKMVQILPGAAVTTDNDAMQVPTICKITLTK